MADGDENFLSRWSRLKREEAANPAVAPGPKQVAEAEPGAAAPQVPAAQLPPLDSLTLQSDFRAFLRPGVDAGLRRAALKKLFGDPRFHFDQMDKLDTYIDDYAKFDPISDEMLKTLDHARQMLFPEEKPVAGVAPGAPQPEVAKPKNENGDPGQDA